jgi:hypothetical protein
MPAITYGELFAYLRDLGFVDASRSEYDKVFEHPAAGSVLVFSMVAADEPARGADLLSAEVRLQFQGLLVGAIDDAIVAARVRHE